jgi:ferredoxin
LTEIIEEDVSVMHIKVDYALCCGSAMCTSIAPRYFELDPGGKLKVLQEEVEADDVAAVDEAINCCPTEAISLADDV